MHLAQPPPCLSERSRSSRQSTGDDKRPWTYLQPLTVSSISLDDITPSVATKITLYYCQLAHTVDIYTVYWKHHAYTRFLRRRHVSIGLRRYNAFDQGQHLHLHRESSIYSRDEPFGD